MHQVLSTSGKLGPSNKSHLFGKNYSLLPGLELTLNALGDKSGMHMAVTASANPADTSWLGAK
jgi:hypothetical protein